MFSELRDTFPQNPFTIDFFSQFSEICIEVMNGDDQRHTMLRSASTVCTEDNFDLVYSIIHIVNKMYHESIKKDDEKMDW